MKQNVRQASGIEEDATNRSACPPWRVALLAGLPWGGLGGGLPFWRFAHTAHILLSTHVVRGHVMESLAGRLDEKDVVIVWVLCLSGFASCVVRLVASWQHHATNYRVLCLKWFCVVCLNTAPS